MDGLHTPKTCTKYKRHTIQFVCWSESGEEQFTELFRGGVWSSFSDTVCVGDAPHLQFVPSLPKQPPDSGLVPLPPPYPNPQPQGVRSVVFGSTCRTPVTHRLCFGGCIINTKEIFFENLTWKTSAIWISRVANTTPDGRQQGVKLYGI